MKKILCFTALLCIINHSFAQNNSDPWPITGNVGIGTTTPATALHVKTTSNTAGFSNLTIENSGATGNEAGIAFKGGYTTASLNSGRIYSLFDGGTSYSFARTTIQSMLVGGVYDNTFTVRNGSVGIGTTTPAGKLQVKMGNGTDLLTNNNSVDIGVNGGTAGWARAFRVVNTSGSDGLDGGAFGVTGIGSTPTYAYMAIPTTEALGYASTKIIALNNLGNVGIGTITPASTLQVVGDARFGSNGTYTDLKISTQTPLSGYNQTNVITPVTAPGSGNAKAALYLKSAGSVGINRMDLLVDGNVGIGSINPQNKVVVVQANSLVPAALIQDSGTGDAGLAFNVSGASFTWGIDQSDEKKFKLSNSTTLGTSDYITITNGTGNIGIGTADTKGYKFAVNGSAVATSMTVKLNSAWPDYVFKKDYKLPTLVKVQEYIDKNGHLPDMPSEKEVADNGLNLGEINKILTKKVEELTLYLIEQNKEMKELKERVLELEKSPQ